MFQVVENGKGKQFAMKRIMVNNEVDLKLAKQEIAVMVRGEKGREGEGRGGEGRGESRTMSVVCTGVPCYSWVDQWWSADAS